MEQVKHTEMQLQRLLTIQEKHSLTTSWKKRPAAYPVTDRKQRHEQTTQHTGALEDTGPMVKQVLCSLNLDRQRRAGW